MSDIFEDVMFGLELSLVVSFLAVGIAAFLSGDMVGGLVLMGIANVLRQGME